MIQICNVLTDFQMIWVKMDPQNYIELRRELYTTLRRSENLLDTQKVDEAFKQIREAFETLQELRRFVDEKREAEFKYDLSLAFQMQSKIGANWLEYMYKFQWKKTIMSQFQFYPCFL